MKKFTSNSYRCLVYKDNHTYTAVCLDLDIIEEDHPTLEQASLSLHDAIETHLKAASEVGNPPSLLYRPAPPKYWNIVKSITLANYKQPAPTEFRIFPTTISFT